MRQQQANWNDRNERGQPQQNSATGSELMRCLENMLQCRDRRQLRSTSHARQLDQRAQHARTHQQQNFGYGHVRKRGPVGMSHLEIRERYEQPHQNRHGGQLQKGKRTMDRIQSAMKFTDSLCYTMAKVRGQMRKANFNPGSDAVSKFRHQESG